MSTTPRRFCVSIAPIHWVPFEERISARAEADTRVCAEWLYNAFVGAVPSDGTIYSIELDEWDREANEAVQIKSVEIEMPVLTE